MKLLRNTTLLALLFLSSKVCAQQQDQQKRIAELERRVSALEESNKQFQDVILALTQRRQQTPSNFFVPAAAFGAPPLTDLETALAAAKTQQKRVLLASFDPKDDFNNQGLQIRYFTDLKETKKLLQENFIIVLLSRDHVHVQKYAGTMNTERPHFFLLRPDGSIIVHDSLSQNPEEGLRIVKSLLPLQ